MRTRIGTALALTSLIACASSLTSPGGSEELTQEPEHAPMGAVRASSADASRPARFAEDGTLLRPKGYRRWVYAGAPLTPNDMNDGKAAFPEFHSVYVDPSAFDHYQRTGEWRDGTVVVKELISVGTKKAASGKGYFMGEFQGLEAMVKDSTRFPEEDGHWGFFRFTDEAGGAVHRSASVLPSSACVTCHSGLADDDLVFTQHYPVLRAAKGFGEGAPEDR